MPVCVDIYFFLNIFYLCSQLRPSVRACVSVFSLSHIDIDIDDRYDGSNMRFFLSYKYCVHTYTQRERDAYERAVLFRRDKRDSKRSKKNVRSYSHVQRSKLASNFQTTGGMKKKKGREREKRRRKKEAG